LPMHEAAETYSTSPHLYFELDIPDDAGPTLPTADRTRAGLSAEAVEDLGGPGGRGRSRRSGSDSGGRHRRDRSRGRAPSTEAGTEAAAAGSTARTPRQRRRTRAGQPASDDGDSQQP
jgi:hypothetical protein